MSLQALSSETEPKSWGAWLSSRVAAAESALSVILCQPLVDESTPRRRRFQSTGRTDQTDGEVLPPIDGEHKPIDLALAEAWGAVRQAAAAAMQSLDAGEAGTAYSLIDAVNATTADGYFGEAGDLYEVATLPRPRARRAKSNLHNEFLAARKACSRQSSKTLEFVASSKEKSNAETFLPKQKALAEPHTEQSNFNGKAEAPANASRGSKELATQVLPEDNDSFSMSDVTVISGNGNAFGKLGNITNIEFSQSFPLSTVHDIHFNSDTSVADDSISNGCTPSVTSYPPTESDSFTTDNPLHSILNPNRPRLELKQVTSLRQDFNAQFEKNGGADCIGRVKEIGDAGLRDMCDSRHMERSVLDEIEDAKMIVDEALQRLDAAIRSQAYANEDQDVSMAMAAASAAIEQARTSKETSSTELVPDGSRLLAVFAANVCASALACVESRGGRKWSSRVEKLAEIATAGVAQLRTISYEFAYAMADDVDAVWLEDEDSGSKHWPEEMIVLNETAVRQVLECVALGIAALQVEAAERAYEVTGRR